MDKEEALEEAKTEEKMDIPSDEELEEEDKEFKKLDSEARRLLKSSEK